MTELNQQQYFVCIHPRGYILKTKNYQEFLRYLEFSENDSWLFKGILSNSDFVHYKNGNSWLKIKVSKIHTSKSPADGIWIDDSNLPLSHSNIIKQIKIGGKISVAVEKL